MKKDYVVYMEPSKSGPLLHADVYHWNKMVKNKLVKDFRMLRDLQNDHPLFALHYEDQGNKHIKFLKIMGFKYFKTISGNRQVYVIDGERYGY